MWVIQLLKVDNHKLGWWWWSLGSLEVVVVEQRRIGARNIPQMISSRVDKIRREKAASRGTLKR